MKVWILVATMSIVLAEGAPVRTPERAALPKVDALLERMRDYEARQARHLKEYEVTRTFRAANVRFKMEATMEVQTTFRAPDKFESKVMKSDGSKTIRDKVFDPILDAEKEARRKEAKQTAINSDNYKFELIDAEDCSGRACFKLKIAPKRKDKFSIEGEIWVDAEDAAIARIHGSPAKRPSFWTRHVEIDRRYKRTEGKDGIWLCDTMDSVSDILIGGRSTLKIEHNYGAVLMHADGH